MSPIPSSKSSIILKLCTLARLTVVPSSSTGSKIAIGFISPVLEALHSISKSLVSFISSTHLKAMESRGNFAVLPNDSPYFISSNVNTSPSEGKSFSLMCSSNQLTAFSKSDVTLLNSTTLNPWFLSQFNCSILELLKSTSAFTREKP